MTQTNKEIEMWKKIKEIKEKPFSEANNNDLNELIDKITDALMTKERQLKEMKESRENWKKKYFEVKNGKLL